MVDGGASTRNQLMSWRGWRNGLFYQYTQKLYHFVKQEREWPFHMYNPISSYRAFESDFFLYVLTIILRIENEQYDIYNAAHQVQDNALLSDGYSYSVWLCKPTLQLWKEGVRAI